MALLSNLRTKLLGLGVIGGIATVVSVGATSSSSPENLPALSSEGVKKTQKNWDIDIPGRGKQRWLDINGNKDNGIWGIKVGYIVSSSTSIPGFTPKTSSSWDIKAEDIENIKKACKDIRSDVEANSSNENVKDKKAHMCTTAAA